MIPPKSQIDAWVYRLIDRIRNDQPHEDQFAEFKAEWPQPDGDTARLIAAHANASRGEPILWIIGLHKTRGVVGAQDSEFSNWYAGLSKHFDADPPYPAYHHNVHVDDKTVVAILFDTSRVPFVVKNPNFNQPGTRDKISFEVPYRSATSTHSAKREHLIRLLAPSAALPECDLRYCTLSQNVDSRVDAHIQIFVAAADNRPVIFPHHRCLVELHSASQNEPMPFKVSRMLPLNAKKSKTVVTGSSETIVHGAGTVVIDAYASTNMRNRRADALELVTSLRMPFIELPLIARARLDPLFNSEGKPSWSLKLNAGE